MWFLLLILLFFNLNAQDFSFKFSKTLQLPKEIDEITGLYVDEFSNYYFIDRGEKKLMIYDADGNLKFQIPSSKENKVFDKPVSVCTSVDGKIIVLDEGADKVVVFDNEGKLLYKFGNSGKFLSSLDTPQKIVRDSENNIYVMDTGADKVVKFNIDGLFLGALNTPDVISICVDKFQNLYVLSEANKSYMIQKFNNKLIQTNKFFTSLLKKPVDICANNFGEVFVLDKESAAVLHFQDSGNSLNHRIGTKMSDKGIGQFSEPTLCFLRQLNEKNEKIYIYDNDFNYTQSFDLNYNYSRTPNLSDIIKFKIKLDDSKLKYAFRSQVISNDTTYYISPDNAIEAKKNDQLIFKISKEDGKTNAAGKYNLSEPQAITKFKNVLYVLDKDENKIHLFEASTGKIIASQSGKGSESGLLKNPGDIIVSKDGILYVADTENNRINIYSSQGISSGEIKAAPGAMNSPIRLALDSKNNLYILTQEQGFFKYNINSQELTSIGLFGLKKPSFFTIVDYDILLIYDEELGTIHMINDDGLFYKFFSRGTDLNELQNVNGIYYHEVSGKLYLSDLKGLSTKSFKLMFEPPIPENINLVINDDGYSELKWETKSNKIAFFNVWRKELGKESRQLVSKEKEKNFIISKDQNKIYEYAVEAVSKDEITSGISNFVKDEFSFYKYISEVKPDSAIECFMKIRSQNEKVIDRRLSIIYRKLANNYKAEKDYPNYFRTISLLEKTKGESHELYLEKSKVYEELVKYREAANELEIANQKFPNDKNIFSNLIRLYFINKDFQKVIDAYNTANYSLQEDEATLESLARALKSLNRNSDALEVYIRLAQSTNKEKYYSKAGRLYYDLNNYDESINYLQKAAGLKSNDPETYATLAACFIQKKDLSNASFWFEEAIKIDSLNANYFYMLGLTYSKQRNTQKAISNLKKACELDSTKADFIFALTDELEKINQTKEASFYLDRLSKAESDNPMALLRAAKIQVKNSKIDEAFSSITRAWKLNQEDNDIKRTYLEIARLREKKYQKEPSIKLQKIELQSIFPSLLNYYSQNPIGVFSIYNTRNFPLDEITIRVKSPQLFKEDFVYSDMVLLPNDVKEINLVVPLKEDLLVNSLSKINEYDVTFEISFQIDSSNAESAKLKDNFRTEKAKIKVETLNSIRWDDKKHLGSFINSRDEFIRKFVLDEIIKKFSDLALTYSDIPKSILNAVFIWEYFRYYGLTYVSDPNNSYETLSQSNSIDFVQFARQTLASKSGDCDDLVALLVGCMESIGISTAYVDIPGHVFLAFDTGISANDIVSKGLKEDKVKILWNKVWIPLESTVIGKNSFVESWLNANERYSTTIQQNKPVVPVQFKQAWEVYPPVQFPQEININPQVGDFSQVRNAIIADLDFYYTLTKGNQEYELLSAVKKHPKNPYLLNKLANYYVSIDSLKKAKVYLEESARIDSVNQITLINLGNIYFKEGNLQAAEKSWLKANKISNETNYGVLINLAKVKQAQGDKLKAREFFDKALIINKDSAIKFANLYKSIYE